MNTELIVYPRFYGTLSVLVARGRACVSVSASAAYWPERIVTCSASAMTTLQRPAIPAWSLLVVPVGFSSQCQRSRRATADSLPQHSSVVGA